MTPAHVSMVCHVADVLIVTDQSSIASQLETVPTVPLQASTFCHAEVVELTAAPHVSTEFQLPNVAMLLFQLSMVFHRTEALKTPLQLSIGVHCPCVVIVSFQLSTAAHPMLVLMLLVQVSTASQPDAVVLTIPTQVSTVPHCTTAVIVVFHDSISLHVGVAVTTAAQ